MRALPDTRVGEGAANKLATLAVTLGIAVITTLLPAYLGLSTGHLLRGGEEEKSPQSRDRYLILTSIAAGLTIWYFLDIMADSAFLGINQLGSVTTLMLVFLFLLGLFSTVLLEPRTGVPGQYDPVFLAAGIIGVHGVGEGIAMGSLLSQSVDPIVAVGGPLSAVSFVIHKAFEAFIVSMLSQTAGRYGSHLVLAGLIIGVPTVVGGLLGFLVSPNETFFFALGGGASVWLLSALLARSTTFQSRFKWSVALAVGIILMFLAGTLHSI